MLSANCTYNCSMLAVLVSLNFVEIQGSLKEETKRMEKLHLELDQKKKEVLEAEKCLQAEREALQVKFPLFFSSLWAFMYNINLMVTSTSHLARETEDIQRTCAERNGCLQIERRVNSCITFCSGIVLFN